MLAYYLYTVFNPHISNARGVLPGILGRGVFPGSGSKSLPYFRPKNVIFYIRFQTWPLKFHTQIFPQRIYVIITRSPSLLRLEQQQKNHSFGIETINTFIHSRSSLENHTDSRPKWTKSIPVFRPKRRKNQAGLGRHILFMAYIREYPCLLYTSDAADE